MTPLLQLENVTAFYGISQALFGVSLTVNEGEVVALMGRNGMGKTTTIQTACRLLPHAEGSVTFKGIDVSGLPSHKVARMGIGLVPEGRRCFPNLTIRENLVATARSQVSGIWRPLWTCFPVWESVRANSQTRLSGGEQQMLAIGRALMTNPKLLILDEATEGLAPIVCQEIWSAISKLKEAGLSILVVDKSLKQLINVADKCVLLEKGESVWSGAASKLTPKLSDRYLGV